MNSVITNNLSRIQEVCKKYKVKELYAFGSVTRNDFKKKSDVDLVFEFKKMPVLDYADYFFGLNDELEKILKRKVDLIVRSALRNKYFIQEVNQTKKKIYEA